MLHSPGTPTLQLLQGVRRSIGGLAAGLAQLIRVDAAYIRVFFILLNILTFGAFGVLYVVAVVLLRRKGFAGDTDSSYSPIPSDRATEYDIGSVPASFRWMIGLLFLLLALIRTMTEFRIFFFNEALFHGIILSVMGMLLAWRGLKNPANQHSLLVLAGASVLFLGIEDLTTALFRVQLSSIGGFEVAFVIAALSITYFCLVLLRGLGERISLVFAALCLVAAGMMMMGVIPARFLLALVQFYDFFYPVIFIGFGLWLALD
jgi:phage shock protein PspC (stress-responsive transcriptional regulator)